MRCRDRTRGSSRSKASSIHGSRSSLSDKNYRAPESEKKLRRLKASYYGLMSEVDDNLGRLFAHLKSTGAYDDTLIVFTSDHGEQIGDHWLLGKCGYFDQSYHIPLIVRDPRASADATRGRTVDAFTENVDIMPTMLEWLGIEVPHACDGRSLAPLLGSSAAPASWRNEAHWEFDFRDPTDDSAERALGIPLHACTLNVIRAIGTNTCISPVCRRCCSICATTRTNCAIAPRTLRICRWCSSTRRKCCRGGCDTTTRR